MRKVLIILLLLPAFPGWAQLVLRLPSILSDHAVLQQNADVRLWGWGPEAIR